MSLFTKLVSFIILEQNHSKPRFNRKHKCYTMKHGKGITCMKKRLISLLLTAVFIGSCAPPPAASIQPPPGTTTQILPLTQTAIVTATLQEQGPSLLLAQDSNLTIMEINGSIRKQIQPPN